MKRFDELLVIICRYFNENNVPFMVIGGVAILYQGRFRTTEDIDIVIIHEKLDTGSFTRYCKNNGLSIEEHELVEGLKEGSHVSILDLPNRLRIDLKGKNGFWNNMAIDKADEYQYEGVKVRVASPEYLIANKLYKGGEIDIEDAYSVYFINKERIDNTLLKELAAKLQVTEKLKLFLAKAESFKNQ